MPEALLDLNMARKARLLQQAAGRSPLRAGGEAGMQAQHLYTVTYAGEVGASAAASDTERLLSVSTTLGLVAAAIMVGVQHQVAQESTARALRKKLVSRNSGDDFALRALSRSLPHLPVLILLRPSAKPPDEL